VRTRSARAQQSTGLQGRDGFDNYVLFSRNWNRVRTTLVRACDMASFSGGLICARALVRRRQPTRYELLFGEIQPGQKKKPGVYSMNL